MTPPQEEDRPVHPLRRTCALFSAHLTPPAFMQEGSSFTAAQVYAAMVVSGAIKGFLQRFSIKDEDCGTDDEADAPGACIVHCASSENGACIVHCASRLVLYLRMRPMHQVRALYIVHCDLCFI
eukprot:1161677-Pelagomonas_calceolata.AAC.21